MDNLIDLSLAGGDITVLFGTCLLMDLKNGTNNTTEAIGKYSIEEETATRGRTKCRHPQEGTTTSRP